VQYTYIGPSAVAYHLSTTAGDIAVSTDQACRIDVIIHYLLSSLTPIIVKVYTYYLLSNADNDLISLVAGEVDKLVEFAACVGVLA